MKGKEQMPERGVDSAIWNDPSLVIKLPKDGKLLFVYLFTNDHCNQAGLYYIALETIQNETSIKLDDLPPLFDMLRPKVEWYKEESLVWVKNFIHRQSHSPLFLKAVGKSLRTIHNDKVIKELIEYNRKKYGMDLEPYYAEPTSKTPAGDSKPKKVKVDVDQ